MTITDLNEVEKQYYLDMRGSSVLSGVDVEAKVFVQGHL